MKAGVRGNWGLRIMDFYSALKSMPVFKLLAEDLVALKEGAGNKIDVDGPNSVGCVLALIWYLLSNIYLLSGENYDVEGEAKAKTKNRRDRSS